MLTGHFYSVGTTRESPSQSLILATQASRNTKCPQCPTPHSTTPRSSKSMGKVRNFLHYTTATANSHFWLRKDLDSHKYPLILYSMCGVAAATCFHLTTYKTASPWKHNTWVSATLRHCWGFSQSCLSSFW